MSACASSPVAWSERRSSARAAAKLGRLLVRLLRLGPRPPRDRDAEPRLRLLPPLEQPVAQEQGREAVLLVVALDPVEDLLVALVHPALVGDDRVVAAPELLGRLHEELAHLLDRVARVRDPERLARDRVQVDEGLAAEELVELLLEDPVLGDEALERRGLVRGVVVDVHVRVRGEALVEAADDALERQPLLVAVVRPDRGEAAVRVRDPVQVLEPAARLPERVALDVVEEVARRRRREEPEPAALGRREQLVAVRAGAARGELERGLVAERLERRRRDVRNGRAGGQCRRAPRAS